MTDLEFGLTLPQWSPLAGPEAYRPFARTAEEVGFDWVGRGDHVVFPVGEQGWSAETPTYEQFSCLAFAAAVTEEITIGTHITVMPHRHPVLLAKQALTLDALSEGRFEFGVGVGWLADEFEVLDVPFEERGARTDEFLDLFEQVCEEGIVAFEGPFHEFDETGFYPRPVQDGGPPVLLGGSSGAAFRRAAQYGAGWALPGSPEDIADGRERLLRAWEDFDRDGEPAVVAEQSAHLGDHPDEEGPLVGPREDVLEGIEAYREAGATRITLGITGVDAVDDLLDQVERFGEDVLASY